MQTMTRFFSSLSDGFQKQSHLGKLFIVLFGLFVLCSFCVLSSVVAISVVNPLLTKRTPTLSPTFTQPAQSTLVVTQVITSTVNDTSTLLPTSTTTSEPVATSTLLNNSMSGFELVSLTSPVFVGGYAKAAIKTAPGAACSIRFTTPSGDTSQDAGLTSQVANKNGICSWRWLIATGTPYGTGIVSITANGTSRSFEITVIVK